MSIRDVVCNAKIFHKSSLPNPTPGSRRSLPRTLFRARIERNVFVVDRGESRRKPGRSWRNKRKTLKLGFQYWSLYGWRWGDDFFFYYCFVRERGGNKGWDLKGMKMLWARMEAIDLLMDKGRENNFFLWSAFCSWNEKNQGLIEEFFSCLLEKKRPTTCNRGKKNPLSTRNWSQIMRNSAQLN